MKRRILPIHTVKVNVSRARASVLRVVIQLLNQLIQSQTTVLSVLERSLNIGREILLKKLLLEGVRHFRGGDLPMSHAGSLNFFPGGKSRFTYFELRPDTG